MYEQHFKLERAPFSLCPDPDFLYLGKQHSSAKAFLESSAFVHDSFVVITGEIGAGKTTLVEGYLAELQEKDTIIARINQTQISPTAFLRLLLDELGLKAFKAKKAELLSRFRKFMTSVDADGRRVVLMIDEAQNLSHEVLEEIRMLTGGQHASALCVVLVGQPEFLQTLRSPALRQLAQRCRLRSHIEALPEKESAAYIDHRIRIAGGDPDSLFTDAARAAVFEASGGIPRLINSVCDTALICAFADGLDAVDHTEIEAALRELNWQQPDAPVKSRSRRKRKRKAGLTKGAAVPADNQASAQARIAELEAELAAMKDSGEALEEAFRKIETLQSENARHSSLGDGLTRRAVRLEELRGQVESLAEDVAAARQTEIFETGLDPLAEEQTAIQSCVTELEGLVAGLDGLVANTASDADALEGLQDKLATLESVNRERLETIEELQGQKEANDENLRLVTQLEHSLAEMSAAKEDLAKELDRLRADLTASDEDRQEQRALLETKSLASDSLAESVNQLTESLAGRDNTIDTLKAEVRAKSSLIDELHDKLQDLKEPANATESLRCENANLVEQLNAEVAANEKYAERIANLEAELAEQSQATGNLERAKEELTASLEQVTREKGRLSEQLGTEIDARNEASERAAELEQALAEQSKTSAEFGQTNQDLVRKLSESGEQNERLSEELRVEAQANEKNSERISDLEQACENQRQKVMASEHEAAGLREEVADKQKAMDELANSVKAAEAAQTALADTVSDLRGQLTTRDNTISTLEAEIRRKNTLLDELHDKLAPLPDLEKRLATLTDENDELSSELESRKERIFELQEAVSLGQQRLDDVRREMDEAQSGQVNLHLQVGELKTALSTASDEAKMREELVTSLQTECQNRKKDLRKLRRELDESVDQSRELSDSLELGEQRIAGLESELQAAMETISEMGESSAQVNSEAEIFEKEIIKQKEELSSLSRLLDEKSAEVHSLENTLRHKTETIKVLQLDADATQEAKRAEETSLNEYKGLVSQLRAEVAARDDRIKELEAAAQEQSGSLADLQQQLGEQSASVQELKEALEISHQTTDELREELGKAEREYHETAVLGDDDLKTDEKTAPQTALEAGLIITTSGNPARRVALSNGRLIIGRTSDSDIKLDNEFASRHHAQIVFRNGRYFLEDLDSTNGIFVNARRVKKRRLRNRDVIRIGKDKLIFVLDQHTSH